MSSVTVLDTVSPVPKATVMMTVASMSPKMMSVVCARLPEGYCAAPS